MMRMNSSAAHAHGFVFFSCFCSLFCYVIPLEFAIFSTLWEGSLRYPRSMLQKELCWDSTHRYSKNLEGLWRSLGQQI